MSSQLSGTDGSGGGGGSKSPENDSSPIGLSAAPPPYTIRPMVASELRSAIAIFAEHDLVEAPATVANFYAIDPEAFLVAVTKNEKENEKEEEVIACIAAPMTTHQTRFLGLYACASAFRGMDIGKRLFTACMEQVVGEDNCGLASVPSKLKVYKHYCGFTQEEKVAIVFYEGVPQNVTTLKTITQLKKGGREQSFKLVRLDAGKLRIDDGQENGGSKLGETDKKEKEEEVSIVEQIIAYDADVHYESRRQLMSLEINQADTCTVAVINETEKRLVGFGLVRPDFLNRPMLGPLYADNSDIAQVLLRSLLQAKLQKSDNGNSSSDQVVCLATTSSSGLNHLATSLLGLPEVERDEKLYRTSVPPFKYHLLYCCHTPSFAC